MEGMKSMNSKIEVIGEGQEKVEEIEKSSGSLAYYCRKRVNRQVRVTVMVD
jgi:hypothetical protein